MKTLACLSIMMFALAVAPAHGDTRDDVMAAMQRCAIIQDDRTWLDCTYGAQQMMRAKLGLPPAPAFQQRLVPPASAPLPSVAAPTPRRAVASAPQPQQQQQQSSSFLGSSGAIAVSTLARVQYDKQGAFVVTLDNGQVWHQANADGGPKVRLRAGTRVAITPGSLWTYNLKADNDPHYYKVTRRS